MQVYLRDGSAQTILRAATLRQVAGQTLHLIQSQYTDAGPASPSADPITPGAWQGSHWSANFEVTGVTRLRKKSRRKRDSNPGSSALEADALTTRPTRRCLLAGVRLESRPAVHDTSPEKCQVWWPRNTSTHYSSPRGWWWWRRQRRRRLRRCQGPPATSYCCQGRFLCGNRSPQSSLAPPHLSQVAGERTREAMGWWAGERVDGEWLWDRRLNERSNDNDDDNW